MGITAAATGGCARSAARCSTPADPRRRTAGPLAASGPTAGVYGFAGRRLRWPPALQADMSRPTQGMIETTEPGRHGGRPGRGAGQGRRKEKRSWRMAWKLVAGGCCSTGLGPWGEPRRPPAWRGGPQVRGRLQREIVEDLLTWRPWRKVTPPVPAEGAPVGNPRRPTAPIPGMVTGLSLTAGGHRPKRCSSPSPRPRR